MVSHQSDDSSSQTIASVERAFKMIEAMMDVESIGVSELARKLDVPKSTAHVYLRTLENAGFVVNESGKYRLSLRFLKYGGYVRNRLKLYQAAKLEVDKLAVETGEVANLGVEENGMRVLLYKSEVTDAIHDNAPIGEYTQMHWTALGKAMLAQFPDERVEAIVDRHGLPRANEYTITTQSALFKELATIREQGYSIENQDRRQGVLTIAVPIFDRNTDEVISAVSVSGPKNRLKETKTRDDLVDAVQSTANVIELRYTHY
jgi:DNA-binding IclR family transcriptional regulator